MLLSTLGPSRLPVEVAQPDERHANRTASVLEWHDRHRALLQHLIQTKIDKVVEVLGRNFY